MNWASIYTKPQAKPTSNDALEARDALVLVQLKEVLHQSVKSWREMVQADLREGIQFRFVTTRSFNAISVIAHLAEVYQVEELTLAIYRMNFPSVAWIKEFVTTRKIPVNILVSDFFRENRRYERWAAELQTFALQHDHVRAGWANNHAKVCLVRTACGRHIVFEGSGNLSDNARIEQYIYEQSEQTYHFHRNWILSYLDISDAKATANA